MSSDRRLPEALDEELMTRLAHGGRGRRDCEAFDWETLRQRGRAPVDWDSLIASAAVHVAVLLVLSLSVLSVDITEVCTLVAEWSTASEETPPEIQSAGPGLPAEIQIEADATILFEVVDPFGMQDDSEAPSSDLDAVALASGLQRAEARSLGAGRRGRASASVPGSGQNGAGPGTAEYFGTVADGDRFVYVLDMSGSMNEPKTPSGQRTRFDRAVSELLYSLDRLDSDQWFFVVLFSDTTRRMFDESGEAEMLPATRENKKRLEQWIASIQPHGGTQPRGAIRLAMSLRPDAVFMLSDGAFDGWKPGNRGDVFRPSPQVESLLAKDDRGQVPIHSFAFEDPQAKANMETLASLTGGRYRFLEPVLPEAPGRQTRATSTGAPPTSAQTPTELLALGNRLRATGQNEQALEAYRELIIRHPLTSAAASAHSSIGEITASRRDPSWKR